MAEDVRRRRAEARERRRSLAARPFEELDEAAQRDRPGDPDGSETSTVLRRSAATALAAATAGALAGALKATVERRAHGGSDEAAEDERQEAAPQQPRDETEARPEPEADESDEQDGDEAEQGDEQQGDENEPDDDEQDENEPDDELDEDEPEDAVSGDAAAGDDAAGDDAAGDGQEHAAVPSSEVGSLVERARARFEEVTGQEPESVSGIRQSDGGWAVTLEVVEVRRVPDSTDVLCSYDVVLDGNGDLLQLERTRRYRRSQVDEGS